MTYTVNMSRYLAEATNPGWETEVDIEDDFKITDQQTGAVSKILYKQMTGLSDKGKPRVYKETYADADSIRVFLSDKREPTELTLTLLFVGPARRDVYDNFCEYLKGYRVKYWDSVRKRKVEMFLSEAVTPSEDKFYVGTPYIQADFKFTNYTGETEKSTTI